MIAGDLATRLQAALGAAYHVERELGGGSMSRVFVAEERALGRRVVIKVLPPEAVADVSAERFRLEIQLVARLQHPNIVPLFTAGDAGGLLYYVMPYVAGESLRARLSSAGPLPLPEAVRVLRDVARALAHAHRQGVVHRDVKPENVLLADDAALVADFGVARALAAASGTATGPQSGGLRITLGGFALGTPAYMAPEQAAADPAADHRVDLYALGCLAYELLAGVPLFGAVAPSRQIVAHATEEPPRVADVRPDVPPALARLVHRCLAKSPEDRPATAAEVLAELEAVATPGDAGPSNGPVATPPGARRSRRRVAVALGVVALVAAAVVATLLRGDGEAARADPGLVVVAPFRVTGDSSLRYLGEGMVDLLAAKLTGEGGPRAADPRAVLSAWAAEAGQDAAQDPAEAVARRLGAGQVLSGSVVGTAARVTITARLRGVGGRDPADATVAGPMDSLPALIDRLAAELLARRAGEGEQRLGALTSTSLPALRAYLAGQEAYRHGRYADATAHLERAVDADSTFALAAVALAEVSSLTWSDDPGGAFAALQRVWALRGRLSPRDRAFVVAYAGRRFPDHSPVTERLAAWDDALRLAPDRPEAWFEYGDLLLHYAPVAGVPDTRRRARAAFERALALDSSFSTPLDHLVEIAALDGDTAAVRRLSRDYLARHGDAEIADFVRWRAALALGEPDPIPATDEGYQALNTRVLERIIGESQLVGQALDDGWRAARARYARARLGLERLAALRELSVLALNGGRPREQQRYLAEAYEAHPPSRPFNDAAIVRAVVFWDGDSAAAVPVVAAFRRRVAASDGTSPLDQAATIELLCTLALHDLHEERTAGVAAAMERIRRLGARPEVRASPMYGGTAACLATLEALLARAEGRDTRAAMARLDSVSRAGTLAPMSAEASLVLARLREESGDVPGALDAVRRRMVVWNPGGVIYLSTFLYEEGRLAERAGDVAGAIRAYRHYLALRPDPEPAQRPAVDRVRAQLARLERTDAR